MKKSDGVIWAIEHRFPGKKRIAAWSFRNECGTKRDADKYAHVLRTYKPAPGWEYRVAKYVRSN